MSQPTVWQALAYAIERLAHGGIEEARLDAEVLMAHTLGTSRSGLFLELDRGFPRTKASILDSLIERRLHREPVAYITGHKEFYGLDFRVTPDTLIPRPETELIVDKALELAARRNFRALADIGTGCGAIAIALATHLPKAQIWAVDISERALEIASANARRHRVSRRVHFLQGNLVDPLPHPVDLITANLPYITDEEMTLLPDDVRLFEPRGALAGGREGLDHIRRLLAEASAKLHSGGTVLMEIGPTQGPQVCRLAQKAFPQAITETIPDLSGKDRVIVVHS